MLRRDYKVALLEDLFRSFRGQSACVIDLGCGDAAYVRDLLPCYPRLTYVGVEPDAARRARRPSLPTLQIVPPAVLVRDYANRADATISLSVLEHVKPLRAFLEMSVAVTKPGGVIWHRYDLGHARFPISRREALIVWACQHLPALVPERLFTTAPDRRRVIDILRAVGVTDVEVDFAQLPGLKQAMNRIDWHRADADDLAAQMRQLEAAIVTHLRASDGDDGLERLFLTVTVRGRTRA